MSLLLGLTLPLLFFLLGQTFPFASPSSRVAQVRSLSLDSSTCDCSGHGTCHSDNTCLCNLGYGGEFCEYWSCAQYRNDDPRACNGTDVGTCIEPDECKCEPSFRSFGGRCFPYCNYIPAWSPAVCSGHGQCLIDEGAESSSCSCDETWSGDACNQRSCTWPGPPEPPTALRRLSSHLDETFETHYIQPMVHALLHEECSGRGVCNLDVGKCEDCEYPYTGDYCELVRCGGLPSNDANVCNGAGRCRVDEKTGEPYCKCEPEDDYGGPLCGVPKCYGIWANETESVCGGHGRCVSKDVCVCEAKFFGPLCSHATCYGKYAVVFDPFEESEHQSQCSPHIWSLCNGVNVTSRGCRAPTGGPALYFGGLGDRIARTVPFASVPDEFYRLYYMTFQIMMGQAGVTGCQVISYMDFVTVYLILYDAQKTVVERKVIRVIYPDESTMNRKLTFEFEVISPFFAIEIEQLYESRLLDHDADAGQIGIDNFFIGVGEYRSPPCQANGQCTSEGECVCFRKNKTEDCVLEECPDRPIIHDLVPPRGSPIGETEIALMGCPDHITMCRVYPSYMSFKDFNGSSPHFNGTIYINARVSESNVTCVIPNRKFFETDLLRVDVYREDLKKWFPVEGLFFQFVYDDPGGGGGSGEFDGFGVTWDVSKMVCEQGDSIRVTSNVELLYPYLVWAITGDRATTVVELVMDVKIEDGRAPIRESLFNSSLNPFGLPTLIVSATCQCVVSGEDVTSLCFPFSKHTMIPIEADFGVKYCENWIHMYDDVRWSVNTLPTCPIKVEDARIDANFVVEPDCSLDMLDARSCDILYPDAVECYVGRKPDSSIPGSSRCCYDERGTIIRDRPDSFARSTGTADYCAPSALNGGLPSACMLPDQSRSTTHGEADVLPKLVCEEQLGYVRQFRYRRPTDPSREPQESSSTCDITGDPHCHTLTRVYYENFGVGAFWILRGYETGAESDKLEVQAYYTYPTRSYVTGVALRHAGHPDSPLIIVHPTNSAQPRIVVNGTEFHLGDPIPMDHWNGIQLFTITASAAPYFLTIDVEYFDGEHVRVIAASSFLGLYIWGLPSGKYKGCPNYPKCNVVGLCGVWDTPEHVFLVGPNSTESGEWWPNVVGNLDVALRWGLTWGIPLRETFFDATFKSSSFVYKDDIPPIPNGTLPFNPRDLYDSEEKYNLTLAACEKLYQTTDPGFDKVMACLIDCANMSIDDVMAIQRHAYLTQVEGIRRSVIFPEVSWVRPKTYDLEGGVTRIDEWKRFLFNVTPRFNGTAMDLNQTIEIRLVESENLYDDEHRLVSLLSTHLVPSSHVELFFSSHDLLGKTFRMTILFGDEDHGYTSDWIEFETRCSRTTVGPDCSIPACYDVKESSSLVCSGHGECLSGECHCDAGFEDGGDCSFTQRGDLRFRIVSLSDTTPRIGPFVGHASDHLVLAADYHWVSEDRPQVGFEWSFEGVSLSSFVSMPRTNQPIISIPSNALKDYHAYRVELTAYGEEFSKASVTELLVTNAYLQGGSAEVHFVDETNELYPTLSNIDCTGVKYQQRVSSVEYDQEIRGMLTPTVLFHSTDVKKSFEMKGVLLPPRLPLSDGKLDLRVTAKQKSTGMTGTVFVSVVLPEFKRTLSADQVRTIVDSAYDTVRISLGSPEGLSRGLNKLEYAASYVLFYSALMESEEAAIGARQYILNMLRSLEKMSSLFDQTLSAIRLLSAIDLRGNETLIEQNVAFERSLSQALLQSVSFMKSHVNHFSRAQIEASLASILEILQDREYFGDDYELLLRESDVVVEALLDMMINGERETIFREVGVSKFGRMVLGYLKQRKKDLEAKISEFEGFNIRWPIGYRGEINDGDNLLFLKTASSGVAPIENYALPSSSHTYRTRVARVLLRQDGMIDSYPYVIELVGDFSQEYAQVMFWNEATNEVVELQLGVVRNVTSCVGMYRSKETTARRNARKLYGDAFALHDDVPHWIVLRMLIPNHAFVATNSPEIRSLFVIEKNQPSSLAAWVIPVAIVGATSGFVLLVFCLFVCLCLYCLKCHRGLGSKWRHLCCCCDRSDTSYISVSGESTELVEVTMQSGSDHSSDDSEIEEYEQRRLARERRGEFDEQSHLLLSGRGFRGPYSRSN